VEVTEEVKAEPETTPTEGPAPDGVMLGIYPSGFLQFMADEIVKMDEWLEPTGVRVTIAATFMDFEEESPETFVPAELEAAWQRGYVPFVNLAVGSLGVPRRAKDIVKGDLDDAIKAWAQAYAIWSGRGERRRAFIAPLQEMNGYWTSYGGDPEMFIAAYHHIQNYFKREGVDSEAVSWVFAPNGWAAEGNEFELYYPGDEYVDVVAFSSFNFGDCSNWPKWETYEEIYQPYLERMTAMAPEKPIFIAEMGTVKEGGDKDQWLRDTFSKLADYPKLRAVIYFNRWESRETLANCPDGTDYRIFYPQKGEGLESFLEVMSSAPYGYYPPASPALDEVMYSEIP
jgi:hypothetical protein